MSEKSKRVYLYIVMVMTLVPALFIVKMPLENSVSSWTLWASAIAGYVGVVFMLWMYAIGTRAISSLFFVDQTKLLKAHSWLGKYTIPLIFLHPIFITVSYGQSWLYSFLPSLATEYDRHVTYGRIAFVALLIIWISSALARGKIPYRVWKYLHFLSYLAVPFAILHIPDTGSSYAAEFSARLYFFMIVVGFIVFSFLRACDLLMYNKYRYRVTRMAEVIEGVYLMDLMPVDTYFSPNPGQYIYIKRSVIGEEHPFSVTQYDNVRHTITVTFKVFGRYTDRLSQLNVGDEVMTMGPFGEFTSEIDLNPHAPAVYVAGGIGVTPFIDRIISESSEREQWLFYANRTPNTAPFENQLSRALDDRLVSVYSESAYMMGNNVEYGHLSAAIFKKYLINVGRFEYFICGPGGMMEAVRENLMALGVDKSRIHIEDFSF